MFFFGCRQQDMLKAHELVFDLLSFGESAVQHGLGVLRQVRLAVPSPGYLWQLFKRRFKSACQLILIGTDFAQQRRNDPFLLIKDGPDNMFGFYLLMTESFGQLLSILNGFLCF